MLHKITFVFLIFTTCSHLLFAENENKRPIYSLKGLKLKIIQKTEYRTDISFRGDVFPIPVDNAIGTNNVNNALSFIYFNEDRIKLKTFDKGFSGWVGTDCSFLPIFSPDKIAWGQTSRFLIYNLKNKTYRYYDILAIIDRSEYISEVGVINAEEDHFFITLNSFPGGGERSEKYLKTLKFNRTPPVESKLFPMRLKNKVKRSLSMNHKNILFLYNHITERYDTYNTDFQKIDHPFSTLSNRNRDIMAPGRLISRPTTIHPTLPLALVGGATKLWMISWKNNQAEIKPLIYLPRFSKFIDFSPDGKWLLVHFAEELPEFSHISPTFDLYAFPVDDSLADYFGEPVKLESYAFKNTNKIWSINPLSFVAVGYKKMARWVIEGR